MGVDPLSAAKAASAGLATVTSGLDSATKPTGLASRVLGLDLIRSDLKHLSHELEKFSRIIEIHHDHHGKADQAIGMLLQEFKHFQERMIDRLDAAEKLAEARTSSQDQALRDFENRLSLLGDIVRHQTKKQ